MAQPEAGLTGLSRVIRSSYLCRRVLPLIDCELEQVLGGLTENEDNSGAGALFKVSRLEFVDGEINCVILVFFLFVDSPFLKLRFTSWQITCKDKSLLLYSKSRTEALTWFKCIRNAIR